MFPPIPSPVRIFQVTLLLGLGVRTQGCTRVTNLFVYFWIVADLSAWDEP